MKRFLAVALVLLPGFCWAAVDISDSVANGFVSFITNASWRTIQSGDQMAPLLHRDITMVTTTNRGFGDEGTVGSIYATNLGFMYISYATPAVSTNGGFHRMVMLAPSVDGSMLCAYSAAFGGSLGTNLQPQALLICATNLGVTNPNRWRFVVTGRPWF